MRSNAIALAAMLCGALALCGCEDKKSTPTPAPATAAPSAAAGNVELTDDDLPVPEDYIDEATKQVNKDNYKAEIDKIEKDIAATPQ